MNTYLYRASPSLFWPQFHSGSQFLAPVKNRHFLQFIHNNVISSTSSDGFSQSVLKRTLHHLYHQIPFSILPEICAFFIGFSCTVQTKMRSLACSLATDCVLANTILISPCPPIPPTNKRMVRVLKKVRKVVTEKPFTSK